MPNATVSPARPRTCAAAPPRHAQPGPCRGPTPTQPLVPPATLAHQKGAYLCGALTTYSTFGFRTVRLLEQRAAFYDMLNAAASIVAGLGAAFVGVAVAEAMWA